MIEKIDGLKKRLSELAAVLNGFKSEAVQLRILDYVLGAASPQDVEVEVSVKKRSRKVKAGRRQASGLVDKRAGGKRKRAASRTGT